MKAFYTILLLIVSNVFMTFAWYGHLKLQETKIISNWPLYGVVLFSWVIALAEYSCQVPANRIGLFRQWRPVLIDATQSDSGSNHFDNLYGVHNSSFQGRNAALESILPLLYVWYWRYILYFINDGLIAFAHYFIYFSIPFVKNV